MGAYIPPPSHAAGGGTPTGSTCTLRLLLLLAVIASHVLLPAAPLGGLLPAVALAPRHPAAACTPLSPTHYNGTWKVHEEEGGVVSWVPRVPCLYSVHSAEAFFTAFQGKSLYFLGDSQQRELFRHALGGLLACCWAQSRRPGAGGVCNKEEVLNHTMCAEVEGFESYPTSPIVFEPTHSGRRVVFTFEWLGFPKEFGTDWHAANLLAVLAGKAPTPSAALMSWGHWDLIFTAPRRADNFQGYIEVLQYSKAISDAFVAAMERGNKHLARVFTWRQMYPDEVDTLPHPQFKKRQVLPEFRALAREGFADLWGRGGKGGGVGLALWDPYAKLELQAPVREWNENRLTTDGMHLKPEVNMELAWELFSYWAESVL